MRRYAVLGLGILLGLAATSAGEDSATQPATQPAAKTSFDAARIAQARAIKIKGVLPKGWSVHARRDIITVKRNEKVHGVYASPVAPAPEEIAWTATIEVRVGLRLSMAQYCRMVSENETARKEALARRPNYDPVDNPIKVPHSLPTHLDGQSSLWISGGYLDMPFEFQSKDVARECGGVYEAIKGLFRPYDDPYLYSLWGTAVNGLQAGLDLERPPEEANGKLRLLFRLRNTGDKPVRVLRLSIQATFWGEYLPIEVKVGRDVMKYRGPMLEPPIPPPPGAYVLLAPGEIDSVELEMNPAHWGLDDLSKATAAFIFVNTNEKDDPGPGWGVITGLWTGTARSDRLPLGSGPVTQPATASGPVAQGKLTIYEEQNQIGVIANRVIEEDGRVAKIIYYRLRDSSARPPYEDSDLVEAGSRTFKYDANGRAYRSETTGLASVMAAEETQWNEDGSLRNITWSDTVGRVSHRNIYRGKMAVTELHYNADGVVAGIRGEIPPDQDLPAWGKTVDDMACAVLPSRARGPFAGVGLWVTARNVGKTDRKIVTIGKTSPEFLVEVHRADGTLVEQDPKYVKQQFDRRQSGNPNEKDVAQTLSAGKAELVAWGMPLSHWYADLPPGKYQVTVTCRSGDEFNLVSNTAAFEIVPAQPASAPGTQPKAIAP